MRCHDTLIDFDLMRYARIIRGVVLRCEFACNSNAPGGFLRLNVRAMVVHVHSEQKHGNRGDEDNNT
jgi:hypothetical protein